MKRRMRLPLLIASLLLLGAASSYGQIPNPADYDPILIPVFFFGSGAHGSQWVTSVELNATHGVVMPIAILSGSPQCPKPCGCALINRVLGPRPTTVCDQLLVDYIRGIYLYVPKDVDRAALHISARVRDLSRQAESVGTEIPVVRPSDLRDGPIMLLDVPTAGRFRVSLRVYDVAKSRDNVNIRIYDANALKRGDRTPLVETVITMPVLPPLAASDPSFPLQPPSAVVIGDLVGVFPKLAAVNAVSIEVRGQQTPADPKRYWAFVSITNNVTQEVTVVSPQ